MNSWIGCFSKRVGVHMSGVRKSYVFCSAKKVACEQLTGFSVSARKRSPARSSRRLQRHVVLKVSLKTEQIQNTMAGPVLCASCVAQRWRNIKNSHNFRAQVNFSPKSSSRCTKGVRRPTVDRLIVHSDGIML